MKSFIKTNINFTLNISKSEYINKQIIKSFKTNLSKNMYYQAILDILNNIYFFN